MKYIVYWKQRHFIDKNIILLLFHILIAQRGIKHYSNKIILKKQNKNTWFNRRRCLRRSRNHRQNSHVTYKLLSCISCIHTLSLLIPVSVVHFAHIRLFHGPGDDSSSFSSYLQGRNLFSLCWRSMGISTVLILLLVISPITSLWDICFKNSLLRIGCNPLPRQITWALIIIVIIGTTAHFEPRPSFEASASCPCSLQHSSNFSLPASWHLPSRRPPILVLVYPFAFFLLLPWALTPLIFSMVKNMTIGHRLMFRATLNVAHILSAVSTPPSARYNSPTKARKAGSHWDTWVTATSGGH